MNIHKYMIYEIKHIRNIFFSSDSNQCHSITYCPRGKHGTDNRQFLAPRLWRDQTKRIILTWKSKITRTIKATCFTSLKRENSDLCRYIVGRIIIVNSLYLTSAILVWPIPSGYLNINWSKHLVQWLSRKFTHCLHSKIL